METLRANFEDCFEIELVQICIPDGGDIVPVFENQNSTLETITTANHDSHNHSNKLHDLHLNNEDYHYTNYDNNRNYNSECDLNLDHEHCNHDQQPEDHQRDEK